LYSPPPVQDSVLIKLRFVAQDMMVMLREAMRFIAHILQKA
jgi:hypothetical protein